MRISETVTETTGTLAVGFGTMGLTVAWLAWSAARVDVSSPERLIAELRLAQIAALLLALTSGIYVGATIANNVLVGSGMDIAFAIGFLIVAALATTWEPSRALIALALAWTTHGLVDLAHLVGVLSSIIVPPWYPTACAIYDVLIASLCCLPVLRQ